MVFAIAKHTYTYGGRKKRIREAPPKAVAEAPPKPTQSALSTSRSLRRPRTVTFDVSPLVDSHVDNTLCHTLNHDLDFQEGPIYGYYFADIETPFDGPEEAVRPDSAMDGVSGGRRGSSAGRGRDMSDDSASACGSVASALLGDSLSVSDQTSTVCLFDHHRFK